MLKKLLGAAPVAMIAAFASLAQADGSNQDFNCWNATGFTIGELHVSSANNDHWGPDVLGRDVLNDGEKAHITFTGFKPSDCIFDIKITKGEGGQSFVIEDIDLCKIDDVAFFTHGGKVMWKAH